MSTELEPTHPTRADAVRNVKLVLRYDGANYHGWQRQPGLSTIQTTLEDAFERAAGERCAIHASGRTDAGVHALAQVAHVHTATRVPTDHLAKAMNGWLPPDIVVTEAVDVPVDFHARHHARRKTYVYQLRFGRQRDPHWARTTFTLWHVPDLARMRAAAAMLVGRHDFRSFTTDANADADTVRTLFALRVLRWREGVRVFATGDGFLMHMVRTLTGVLVAAGIGRLTPEGVRELLSVHDRRAAPAALPAHALFLWRVDY
ncbi:MAG: tRNA pseudouridine(38-40) synthase TruA [Planctomycetes bacterium]|nr:tRNA pseudouridine(38-40) synthase TruA [Planctomycetota bacterium]